ncbi:MAG: exodeoxyribonuclease V subunit gamma [Ferruginibacter sp.]
MPTQLYVSNSLTQLAKQLSTELQQNPLGVFVTQQIVTQTEGMNSWLKIKLAENTGITANCAFNKPNDIVTRIYFWLGGASKQALAVDFVKWNIYHLLSDADFLQKFPFIASYYANHEVKQIALATKVADLFDQYQMYRPDIIQSWNAANISSVKNDWQQYLWIRIQQLSNETMLDKTGMIEFIIDALQNESKQHILKSKLPRLQFFGIAVITPFYLKLFNALSNYISISFYLINPAPLAYWLEDKSEKDIARLLKKQKQSDLEYVAVGNSLLNSWGTIIKDSFSLLFQDEAYINYYNDDLAVPPDHTNTLLKIIQADIFLNATEEERNIIPLQSLKDGSLVINACFTPVREVEVLYNYLVHLVDEQKEVLSPRDIVVMVTDIDSYAPYIRAIFDNAPYHFPYTIADEKIVSGNNMFTAIELVLSLKPDSFKVEEILELLESPYIRNRFGITDIETIRKAVAAANIRFGFSGAYENDTRYFSWAYGLKRIMYGICMYGEPVFSDENDTFVPLDIVEGNATQGLIQFTHFIEVLHGFIEARQNKKSLAQWIEYLQLLVENIIFEAGEKEDEDYQYLVNYLEKLTSLIAVSDAEISFEVFKHSFLDMLHADSKSQSFGGSGITFCSLIPMRSIPFKVVAMLGMNFDQFPRKESKLSFNLLEQQKRKGDRNIKDNDKHLFLETILSAEKYLYLSYLGKSSKDGAKIPPSSLVDELMDYILRGVDSNGLAVPDTLVTQHPLHGFSQQYFNGGELYAYLSDDKYKSELPFYAESKDAIDFTFDEISVHDLQRFFKDPIKFYFNKGLGIYYNEEEVLLPDTELFEVEKLQKWGIVNDLLYINEADYASYFERAIRSGALPLKNMGQLQFNAFIEKVQPMKDTINALTQNEPVASINIKLLLNNILVTGTVGNIYGDKMILFTDSKNFTKHAVDAYLCYLLATAQGEKVELIFIPFQQDAEYRIAGGTISKEAAIRRLEVLVGYYTSGFKEPFLFVPNFSKPFDLFQLEASEFVGKIESLFHSEYDYTFNNEWMIKAYENDFFEVENFDALQKNTLDILEEINQLMPGVIQ